MGTICPCCGTVHDSSACPPMRSRLDNNTGRLPCIVCGGTHGAGQCAYLITPGYPVHGKADVYRVRAAADDRARIEAETVAKIVAYLVARAAKVKGEGEYELVALIDAAADVERGAWRKGG